MAEPDPDPVRSMISHRATARIERIFAIVTSDAHGVEGVVRRDTPIGTQPLTTDDEQLARELLLHARGVFGPDCYIAAFRREA